MNLTITSLKKFDDEGLAMRGLDTEKLQAALIGFTEETKAVLAGAQKALDGVLTNILLENKKQQTLYAQSALTGGEVAKESKSFVTNLKNTTDALGKISANIQDIQKILNLTIESHTPSNQLSAPQLEGLLNEGTKLNSKLHVQLFELGQITGKSHHRTLDEKALNTVIKSLEELAKHNQAIRTKYLPERGQDATAEKKSDATQNNPSKGFGNKI